jgi:predicted DNA-binding protein
MALACGTREEAAHLEAELARLREELEERRANIPAHTIRPHQILLLEELEERIAEICRRLGAQE